MIGAQIVPLYTEAPLLIMSTVLAAQLRAITHPAGMARGDLIALEPYLCTTQSLSMPDTCGLRVTLQGQLHFFFYSDLVHCIDAQYMQVYNLYWHDSYGQLLTC